MRGGAEVGGDVPRAVLLTQDPALLPHRTVLGNVVFACRDEARARRELAAVGASGLADRFPASLSGGQAARVALARALAADTEVILLDEPFAALDAASAASLRQVLRRRLRGRTAMLVTHDPVDVATLADRVIVIEDGRIAAAGSPADLLAAPVTPFLAQFAGLIAVRGTAIALDDATVTVRTPAGFEITGVPAGAGAVVHGKGAIWRVANRHVANWRVAIWRVANGKAGAAPSRCFRRGR
nr:ATP-binding cassette domain-containing protein [Corynebacterium xerosis]